jgi:altronate hydrolase
MGLDELVVGTKCGGSDATSGLTANPAMGRAFDFLVEQGATCMFEEIGELIGMEHWMAERAESPALGREMAHRFACCTIPIRRMTRASRRSPTCGCCR